MFYFVSSCNFFDNHLAVKSSEKGVSSRDTNESQFTTAKHLIATNDCAACHHERDNMIGPSFIKIAQRYNSKDIPMLTKKIINGGQGNWGEIPMTAHPGLSELEASEIAHHILKMK